MSFQLMWGAVPVPLQNRGGSEEWGSCPVQQAPTNAWWGNNAQSVAFGHRPLLADFGFLNSLMLSTTLCLSLALTSIYHWMFATWLWFPVGLWIPAASALFQNVFYFYYCKICHFHSSASNSILPQIDSIHQWPWIVPIQSFHFKSCPNLDCLTLCVGLCPVSYLEYDIAGEMTIFVFFA